ncbi:glycosyltransferase family 87 protein [Bradyrhizobium sp. CCBAU 53338]|uniref:glycosyltransferase family 87 protein n=1 Tax=Bradyrhizobium sp. CCBAU 53338 TaxID=1325111 RepID=UPI00188B1E7A|nr:glycosyltransferase family 87 protein [Bradyrhizobium sp. CCBAU 53338]
MAELFTGRQTRYARYLIEVLTVVLLLMTSWFSRWGRWQNRKILDFDTFYIVAQRVWHGDVERAYYIDQMLRMEMDASGGPFKPMPWTYPPQFDLLVAPLALLPVGGAYFLFVAATLSFYLLILKAISQSGFTLISFLLLPSLLITLIGGQNGFLTGGLIGLACLTIERRQVVAGLSLGAMVVKPHLAVAFAVYVVLARRWIALVIAIGVVLSSSIICTVLLGPGIWSAFFVSVHASADSLARGGVYPLYRMVSVYAGLRTAGFPASLAFLGQVVAAILSLFIIAFVLYRRLPTRWCVGLAAVTSLLISPYAYDYDLLILGMGIAILLPEITRRANAGERITIYSMMLFAECSGVLQALRVGTLNENVDLIEHQVASFGGFAVVGLVLLILRVLLRDAGPGALCKNEVPAHGAEVGSN